MSGAIHPLPQYASMAWCSVKAQGQLYLYLYLDVILLKMMKMMMPEVGSTVYLRILTTIVA